MGFSNFGRGIFGGKVFGKKNIAGAAPQPRVGLRSRKGSDPIDRLMADAHDLAARQNTQSRYRRGPEGYSWEVIRDMAPEERGELLVAVTREEHACTEFLREPTPREQFMLKARDEVFRYDIEIKAEDLGAILSLLTGLESFRTREYYDFKLSKMMDLIDSAIKQGAYLSAGDCDDLAAMAAQIREKKSYYRKADKKRMLARAERLEKMAGAELSSTEILMQRCEGAENPWALSEEARPNAQFWADLLAEVAATLDEIRKATKGSKKPAWASNAETFAASWPACGEIRPDFGKWKASGQPVAALKEHNGKRNGWAEPAAYRGLPEAIDGAVAYSRYQWGTDQIPGLDVLADLENPDWTALVEHLITQRRATKATKTWAKEALALAKPIGLDVVEERVHAWLALFHTPALGREGYTSICNGERFIAAIGMLEESHPDWPQSYADRIDELGRAIGIVVASGGGADDIQLAPVFRPSLVRLDDHSYKNKSATTGVLHMPTASYRNAAGASHHGGIGGWLRLSVENEDFLRGVVWLTALLPDRARAIEGLEKTAQSAATYMWTGDDAMRSKVIANAAIATLIAMGGDDIDAAVLRLSKTVEHQSVQKPLHKHLNA